MSEALSTSPRRRGLRIAVRVVVPLLFALALWHLFTHVVRFGYVTSRSMEPTLQPGDYYILALNAYREGSVPERGDIIVYYNYDGTPYVKRVIARGGETIILIGGRVWLNGALLAEPYLKERPFPARPIAVTVPQNHVFVLGDNRNLSEDSRDLGPIPLDRVMGRVTRIVWPLSRARVFTPVNYSRQ